METKTTPKGRRPKGNMLRRKLWRDLLEGWKSFVAIFIICALSVTLYCGIDASWRGMERNLDEQFEVCNLADLWVEGEVSDRMAEQLAVLPGVADAQRRVALRGTVKDLPEEPSLDVYMSEGKARINKPMVFSEEPLPGDVKNLCVLNESFAETNGYQIGDMFTVELNGQRLQFAVAGIGYSSEYVVYSDGVVFRADPAEFGYAMLSPGSLTMFPYNEVVMTLAPGASLEAVKESVERLVDDAEISVLVRDDKMGLKMAIEEVEQIRALGLVFPVVFFLVAALITWSTMKRLVANQRMQIGTLRSMGYSQGQLKRHYTAYGLLVAFLGSVVGLVGAYFFFGNIIVRMLQTLYVMPDGGPYLDPFVAAGISVLTMGIGMAASYFSCRKSLREVPAMLLRPKPPKRGKRVFLEKIPFIWRHLSFSNKMVVRNLFRKLSRFFIGLLGVVGCVALLLTGFGMRDSVKYVLDHHFGYTMRYDVRVTLDTPGLTDSYLDALRMRSGAQNMESMMDSVVEMSRDGGWETKQLTVLEDQHNMVYLEDAEKNRVWLPQRGVAVTEKFSEDTGIQPGDTIRIRTSNGHIETVPVTSVISIQLGQGIYVTRSYWRQLDLMPYSPTVLMLQGGTIDMAMLADMDGVDTVRTLEQEKESNSMVVRVLDLVVGLMVLFAGGLALVVLFTLGQLNFFERQRELATLMVLGFFPRENKRIILRENIIIAVLGIPIGLFLGPYLHSWVLSTGLPNTLEFIPYIAPTSWIYTSLLTLFFAQLVNWMIGSKFKDVDMVAALKSVE